MLIFTLFSFLGVIGDNAPGDTWATIPLGMIEYVPAFTLVPRFLLNLRELYARDLRGRCGGDIDTAFGLSSSFGRNAIASAIMFAEAGDNDGEQRNEGIRLGERVPEICLADSSGA